MNLEELIKLLKRSKRYLIGVGIVLLVLWGVYYYFDNPAGDRAFGKLPSPTLESSVSDKVKIDSNQTLKGRLPHLVEVYKLTGLVDFNLVKSKLGVEGQPTTEKNFIRWDSLSKEFVVNTTENTFSYRIKTNVGNKNSNEDQAYNSAFTALKNLGLVGPEVTLEKSQTSYLFGGFYHVEEVAKESNYNIYAFEIAAKLNDLNIVDPIGSKSLYRVQVGVDGQVRNIDASLQQLAFSEKSTYPVKHLPQIKSEIEKNQATIVSLSMTVLPSPNQTLPLNYNQGYLVYLLSSGKEEYLQPVVVLSNQEVFRQSQVIGILPALKNFSYQK